MSVETAKKEDTFGVACDYPCELTMALENKVVTKTVGTREPLSLISSNDLNVGYGGKSTAVQNVVRPESSRETVCLKAPETPQRAPEVNPGTPLTPMANLKVLIAAASSAFEKECASRGGGKSSEVKVEEGGSNEDTGGRKMKSLAVLCKKFLSVAETNVGIGNDFSLEMMSQSLDTNRRRIYDIINVLEALEMIVKQSKNWYTWLGSDNILVTLAKMRAMAQDDPEYRALLDKENTVPATPQSGGGAPVKAEDYTDDRLVDEGVTVGFGNGRWDKSLGVLCQKFVMLFLVTPEHEVTLDYAGNVLMPDTVEYSSNGVLIQPVTNPKTKVRRLYDIANVLTTLGLIKKKTFLAPNHRKMPGYSWSGPSIAEIQTISVFRKSEYNLYPFYSKKKGAGGKAGVALSRKPSLGSVRPFLHQYEVKAPGTDGLPNSAPTTPIKSQGGFRRSLSFGAGPSRGGTSRPSVPVPIAPAPPPMAPASSKNVVARPLCPKQLNYSHELQEFEAEVLKHSHKYPHVAFLFHEFIRKYQSTLEQVAASGRSILPKLTVNGSTATSAPTSIKPPFSPGELAYSLLGLTTFSTSDSSGTTNIISAAAASGKPSSNASVELGNNSGPVLQLANTKSSMSSTLMPSATLGAKQYNAPVTESVLNIGSASKPQETSENIPSSSTKVLSAAKDQILLTPSSTYGTLMSPGDKSRAFMSVEEVLVPAESSEKRPLTDSTSKQNVQPEGLLLPTTTMTLGSTGAPVVQQTMQVLGSLVNQKPILASSAFPSATSTSQLKVNPKPTCLSASSLIAATIPRVVHSQPQRFNPAALLTDPASQLVQCALQPNLYYQSINPAFPVTTSFLGIPSLYQTVAGSSVGSRGVSYLRKKSSSSDCSEMSLPKRPHLE